MCGTSEGSTNSVDQLLRDADGPGLHVQKFELTRLERSAFIVHRNFFDIDKLGDDVLQNGMILPQDEIGEQQLRTEVFKTVHNYLASLYSFVEQARSIIDSKRAGRDIDKGYFLPNPNKPKSTSAPGFVRKLVFLWGLRNQFTHEEYRCLTVEKEYDHNNEVFYELKFTETEYSPTPEGGLDQAGDYLRYSNQSERKHPLCYIGRFHREQFNTFEEDLRDWCCRSLKG